MNNSRHAALVILAAGLGTRFGGGIKQLQKVGPNGEIIMDYSIRDAIAAGFDRVVFIIRHDIEDAFREVIGERIEKECAALGVSVGYAYQERADLPAGFDCPEERVKPWGTGHALLACRGVVDCPFVVVNADDYYGGSAFRNLRAYLTALEPGTTGRYCMAGFRMRNTLSEHGAVTRGICEVTGSGNLVHVIETKGITRSSSGACVVRDGEVIPLDPESAVSMNMWGFTPDVFQLLERDFITFLEEKRTVPNSEFLIPIEMECLLREGSVSIRVLPTEDRWLGITFQEDLPGVMEEFRKMAEE